MAGGEGGEEVGGGLGGGGLRGGQGLFELRAGVMVMMMMRMVVLAVEKEVE